MLNDYYSISSPTSSQITSPNSRNSGNNNNINNNISTANDNLLNFRRDVDHHYNLFNTRYNIFKII